MAEKLKINVSFPQYDRHIYDFIKSQPNPSAFIRKLVEAYMNGTTNIMMVQHQVSAPMMFNQQFMHQQVVQQQIMNQEQDDDEDEVKLEEIDVGEFEADFDDFDGFDALNNLGV